MDRLQPTGEFHKTAAVQQELWLRGQPPLNKYLDYVEDLGIAGATANRIDLVAGWRAANEYYDELAETEAGIADNLPCMPLDPELEALAAELMADPCFRQTFNSLPSRIAMVELDRLVVCQNHVTQTFVDELKLRLGPKPGLQSLFHFCLPASEYSAPVKIREAEENRYIFHSSSTDFRFHEAVLLRPEQLQGYESFGQIAGVIGLVVGFSSNFLNAICDEDSNRLLLHNGYHRACALRELGITHAPCVIQTVSSRDELDIIAKPIVSKSPGYFFNAPRPPLLKDFWDPKIRNLLTVKKMLRTIELSYEIRDYLVQE